MHNVIEKNKAFLQLLATTKSIEQRHGLLETATPGQVRALSQIALNLFNKHPIVALDEDRKATLNKKSNIKILKRLSTKERPYGRKRQTLINVHDRDQTGDGLLSFIVPLISQLFGL